MAESGIKMKKCDNWYMYIVIKAKMKLMHPNSIYMRISAKRTILTVIAEKLSSLG